MRDMTWRLGGLLCLLGAAGSTLLHRSIYETAKHGPAQIGELAAGLVTFMSACLGILLLIQGARLFATPGENRHEAADPGSRAADHEEPRAATETVALDSRDGVALVLARRAIAAAATRPSSATDVQSS